MRRIPSILVYLAIAVTLVPLALAGRPVYQCLGAGAKAACCGAGSGGAASCCGSGWTAPTESSCCCGGGHSDTDVVDLASRTEASSKSCSCCQLVTFRWVGTKPRSMADDLPDLEWAAMSAPAEIACVACRSSERERNADSIVPHGPPIYLLCQSILR